MAHEQELAAALGRKQIELEKLQLEYDRLLTLASWMASGEVLPSRVQVDLKTRTWRLEPLADDTGNAELAPADAATDVKPDA